MPIPTPKPGESEADFISRCMSDSTMKNEYPEEDQRAAVCYGKLDAEMIRKKLYKIWHVDE